MSHQSDRKGLRRQLGGHPGIGQRPAGGWSGGQQGGVPPVPPYPPTQVGYGQGQPGYRAPQPGFEPTRRVHDRGTKPLVNDSIDFAPTQGDKPGGNFGRRPVAHESSGRGQGSPIARGLSGSLFAVYRPYARAGRRVGGPRDAVTFALDGDARFDDRRFHEARDCYRSSIELDPENPVVHVDLGRAYCALQQLMDAEAAFLRAIELDSLLIAAYRNRYLAIDMMTGRLPELSGVRREAQAACEDVLGAEVRDPAGLANLGDAYCCLSRYREALRAYEQALAVDAANPRLVAKRDYARRQGR